MATTDISISFGANTDQIQQAMENIRQSVRQTCTGISTDFQKVNVSIEKTKNTVAAYLANITTALRNGGRIIQAVSGSLSAPLQEFSRWEDAATRLAPLVGGLEAAKQLCEELRDEAANGTMSFEQLASVAGRLASVFKSSSDIKKWTTAFHDLSAGTGLDVNELVGNFVKEKRHSCRFSSEANRSCGNAILFQIREVPASGGNLLRFDAIRTRYVPVRFSGIRECAF